jgi:hypothetical protein
VLEVLAKQKKVYTATYKRGTKPSVVVRACFCFVG